MSVWQRALLCTWFSRWHRLGHPYPSIPLYILVACMVAGVLLKKNDPHFTLLNIWNWSTLHLLKYISIFHSIISGRSKSSNPTFLKLLKSFVENESINKKWVNPHKVQIFSDGRARFAPRIQWLEEPPGSLHVYWRIRGSGGPCKFVNKFEFATEILIRVSIPSCPKLMLLMLQKLHEPP